MRADLSALTPEALAVLANMGLVKRAQKEIAAGQGPSVTEEENGTVHGSFPDGSRSTLPPGKALAEGSCTCGATSLCRHRIATVLVYIARGEGAEGAPPSPAEPNAVESEPDDDGELKAYLGPRLYDKALKLRSRTRARVEGEGLVHLDTCGVRFLSGRRLEFARCDCRAAGPCEHLALALWALRGTLEPAASEPVVLEPLDGALAIISELIEQGAAHLGQGLGSRFEEARRELSRARMTWPHELLEEVEAELTYYRNRGGRYRAARLAWCATSLWARRQVSARKTELAVDALGLKLAPETSLRQLRLTGLGCRSEKDETRYFLADSTTGRVLVLELKSGFRPSGLTPLGLAAGQLVSADAHRRANGLLRLGRGPHSLSGCASWDHLGKLFGPPPPDDPLLGECHAAPAIRILAVATVLGGYYSPGHQELSLHVETEAGVTRVALSHRAAAPFALESLWSAREALRAVAGVMEREGRGWLMRPTALLCEQKVVIPDLATEGSLENAPLGQPSPPTDPLSEALLAALACWHETVHRGLGASSERARAAASALRKVGLERTAVQLESAHSCQDWLRLSARLLTAGQLLTASEAGNLA